ncbi:MAG: hypothetical protein ABJI60_02700 [Kangiellaceae bacterium]
MMSRKSPLPVVMILLMAGISSFSKASKIESSHTENIPGIIGSLPELVELSQEPLPALLNSDTAHSCDDLKSKFPSISHSEVSANIELNAILSQDNPDISNSALAFENSSFDQKLSEARLKAFKILRELPTFGRRESGIILFETAQGEVILGDIINGNARHLYDPKIKFGRLAGDDKLIAVADAPDHGLTERLRVREIVHSHTNQHAARPSGVSCNSKGCGGDVLYSEYFNINISTIRKNEGRLYSHKNIDQEDRSFDYRSLQRKPVEDQLICRRCFD